MKEETERAGLKLNVQKLRFWSHHFMGKEGEEVETVADSIFLGSTVDSDCSHNIKRHLLVRRKAMTKLDSILKSRDITLPTKVHLVRLWFFQ